MASLDLEVGYCLLLFSLTLATNSMVDFNLLPFQVTPYEGIKSAFWNFHHNPKANRGRLLIMPAGTGKTYVLAKALAEAQANGWINNEAPFAVCDVLFITAAKVITQSQRVLLKAGVKNFQVTSHASMSRSFGEGMLTWVSKLRGQEIVEQPVWDKDFMPRVIILDESQYVKNHNALISDIIESAVKQGILVILASATPFTRPSETTITNLALRLVNDRDHNKHFMGQFLCHGGSYDDYTPGSMKNYNDYLVARGLKVSAEDIHFAHRVFNKCILVDFPSPAHRKMYEDAYKEYIEACIKNDRSTPEGIAEVWVAMLKFRQSAELIRASQLAKVGYKILTEKNKQIIIASNFRDSLEVTKDSLIQVHGVKPNNISIIVGGRNCQKDIDAFQYGKTDFCLLTLKSGGAGLSLHHEHKIARPRYGIIPPTWSAIELVQLLGRAHRINSLSTTYQDVVWFRDTIEEEVAAKVAIKMRSLQEIVSRRETWIGLFSKLAEQEAKSLADRLTSEDAKSIGEGDEEEGNMYINSLPLSALEDNEVNTQPELVNI